MLGNKQFELTNHLGNVMVTLSDMRIAHNNGGTIDYYNASVTSATDYFPGGMPLPNRSYSPTEYKYGHNGQLKDDDIYGNGNAYTAEYWEYDSRLIRRWNKDPVVKEWESPYACFEGNPIYYCDPSGLSSKNDPKNPDPSKVAPNNPKDGDVWNHLSDDGKMVWQWVWKGGKKKGEWTPTGEATSAPLRTVEITGKDESPGAGIRRVLTKIGAAIAKFLTTDGGCTLTSENAKSSNASGRNGLYGDFISVDEFKLLLLKKFPNLPNAYGLVEQMPAWARTGRNLAIIAQNFDKIAKIINTYIYKPIKKQINNDNTKASNSNDINNQGEKQTSNSQSTPNYYNLDSVVPLHGDSQAVFYHNNIDNQNYIFKAKTVDADKFRFDIHIK